MKKLFLLVFVFFSSFVYAAQPLLLIKPFRETFLHFPSSHLAQEGLVVTVFLPEAAVPLHQKYPVIYAWNIGPEHAQAVKEIQDAYAQKALVVGINLGENATATTEQQVEFLARELVPYIDVNYLTQAEPASRALAISQENQADLAAQLLKKKDLFGRFVFLNPGEKAVSLAGAHPELRALLAGHREEVLVWQETLQDMGYTYGTDFVTRLTQEDTLPAVLNIDYLFAQDAAVQVKKLTGAVVPQEMPVSTGQAHLSMQAVLANGAVFDYVPLSVRLSPPYLHWNAADGVLSPISGAEPKKVKMSVFVDKAKFNTKIRLKK